MSPTVVTLIGAAMLLLTLADIFLTVLYARRGTGLIAPWLMRGTWALLRALPPRRGGWHGLMLSFAGPVILVVIIASWVALLAGGFALLLWPMLGHGLIAGQGPTDRSFVTALYVSGYNLTTLGIGDLATRSNPARLLTIAEAAIGFSVLTLSLTYFMSIYAALVRRNALAQTLDHLTGGSGRAADMAARLAADESAAGAQIILVPLATGLLDLLESHRSYPVLHYFRDPQPRFAAVRISLIALDGASLMMALLDRGRYPIAGSVGLRLLYDAGVNMVCDSARRFVAPDLGGQQRAEWRAHFDGARAVLASAGLALAEVERAWPAYCELRRRWDAEARCFARSLAYRWPTIEPDAGDRERWGGPSGVPHSPAPRG